MMMKNIFISKIFYFLLIIYIIIITIFTNCNYHSHTDIIKQTPKIEKYKKYIILNSYEPFNTITQTIRTKLNDYQIHVINYSNDDHSLLYGKENLKIPQLNILKISEEHITNSIFQNGKESEYQIIIQMYSQLVTTNNNWDPINIRVRRALIKNPENFLFNEIQEQTTRKEMYT